MAKQMTSTQAALAKRREATAAKIASMGGGSSNRIRVKNRTFTLPDDTMVQNHLDIVVLGWNFFKQYYKEAYSGENSFPDCFAVGDDPRTLMPSENSPEIQHENCLHCPWNQFETAATGKGKACQDRVQIACQIAAHGPESDVMRLSVSPTGLKSWRGYARMLEERGALPVQVVTRVEFNTKVSYDSLLFSATKKVAKEELDQYAALMDEADKMLATEPKPPSDDDE